MSRTSDLPSENTADRELVITRTFRAPRRLLFEVWTRTEHLDHWFYPQDFKLERTGSDLRPGGEWFFVMHAPDGEEYRAGGVYREIVPDERLVFTHAWLGDDGKPEHETLVTVTFADQGDDATVMTFRQAVFRSVESRDRHRGGWGEVFDNLSGYLASRPPVTTV